MAEENAEDLTPPLDVSRETDDPAPVAQDTPPARPRRGRPPRAAAPDKPPASAPRGTAAVESAVGVLEEMYGGIELPLILADNLMGYPTDAGARSLWIGQVPDLLEKDRRYLALDPKLTKSINEWGKKGGRMALIAAHVVAATPVVMALWAGISAQRAARREQRGEMPEPSVPEQGGPGALPGMHF